MAKYKSVVKSLQKHYSDAKEVAIISKEGKLLFATPKWNIKNDIKKFLKNWQSGGAQSVELDGIRYSVLQMEPERFIGTNRHKKGNLVGATTPDKDKIMIAHIKPKAKGWFHMAYPAVARAAAMMKKGSQSEFIKNDIDMEKIESPEAIANYDAENKPIDPYLKVEIEGFLEWIKNPQGLFSYVSQALREYDQYKIAELANVYYDFYYLFYD